MKVLQITPEAPDFKSGGTIGVLQSLLMLKQSGCCVDYIGPEIPNKSIASKYSKLTFLKKSSGFFELLFTFLSGQTNKRYMAWKRLIYDFSDYDLVYLDFTKQDYVIKRVFKTGIPVVVRVHNIEYDYSKNDYRTSKTLKTFFVYLSSKKKERFVLKKSNEIIALTDVDKQRILNLYGLDKNINVIPVCLDANNKMIYSTQNECTNILINGSLWYGPNLDGINWFLKSVYPFIKCNNKLIIAGSNPPPELIDSCEKLGVEIVPNPKTMDSYLEWADIVVAPIFSGAGMKVKIAEALSYGKIVITTKHGSIGYHLTDGLNSFVRDDASGFLECIHKYSMLPINKKNELSLNARNLFDETYSIACGSKLLEKIINKYADE